MMCVSIDGRWVPSASGISWSDRYGDGPCGPYEASFTVDVALDDDSSWLRLGRTVEVFEDGIKVFGGPIAQMGRDYPRSVYAKGWSRTVEGESTVVGHKFGRTAENVAYTPTDPTDVSWFLDASLLEIGVADDGLFTAVRYTYVDSIDGAGDPVLVTPAPITDAAAVALYGTVTYDMDLTDLGVITGAAAADLAQAQLDQFTIPQWLSRVAATEEILFTAGGRPAHLGSVRAGQLVQLFNVPNNLAGIQGELGQQVILGESSHMQDSPLEVSIAPVRLAVRNLLDALRQAAQLAKAAA